MQSAVMAGTRLEGQSPGRQLDRCGLRNVDLTDTELTGANLTGCRAFLGLIDMDNRMKETIRVIPVAREWRRGERRFQWHGPHRN